MIIPEFHSALHKLECWLYLSKRLRPSRGILAPIYQLVMTSGYVCSLMGKQTMTFARHKSK